MRLLNRGKKTLHLHLSTGYTVVPPRVWYPAEGQPELPDADFDDPVVRNLRFQGVLEARKSAPPAPAESAPQTASPDAAAQVKE